MLVKGLLKSSGMGETLSTIVDAAVTGFTAYTAVKVLVDLFSDSKDDKPSMPTSYRQEVYTGPKRSADVAEKEDKAYQCSMQPWLWYCDPNYNKNPVDEALAEAAKGFQIDENRVANYDPNAKTNIKDATSQSAAAFSAAHAALMDAAQTNGLIPLDPNQNNGWTGVTHDENGQAIYTDAAGNVAIGTGEGATVYNSSGDVIREGKQEVASSSEKTITISSLI